MNTDTTRAYVEASMRGKLANLSMAALAIHEGLDVADDESGMMPRGHGIDASTFLRELVLETKTSGDGEYTDFMLALGGPTIWLRSYTRTEHVFIYGNAAGLPEPIRWSICGEERHDATYAVVMLLDIDFMDEGKDRPSWDRSPF